MCPPASPIPCLCACREIASLQQQRQAAQQEEHQLRAEVQQLHRDVLGVTSAKEEALRFLAVLQVGVSGGVLRCGARGLAGRQTQVPMGGRVMREGGQAHALCRAHR